MITPDDADPRLQALVLVKLPSVLDDVGSQYLEKGARERNIMNNRN